MNVNACLAISAIQEIETAVDWYNQINVPPVLNAQRMKNVKRMNAVEWWNVDQPVKTYTAVHKRFVCQTIILPSANVQLVHGLEIHTIWQPDARAFHVSITLIVHQRSCAIDWLTLATMFAMNQPVVKMQFVLRKIKTLFANVRLAIAVCTRFMPY